MTKLNYGEQELEAVELHAKHRRDASYPENEWAATILCLVEDIRSLQQEVSQLKAQISANPGALSQDKGEGVQAELTAEQVVAKLNSRHGDGYVIRSGTLGFDVEGMLLALADSPFTMAGIRREVRYYDLQASPSPLEGTSPQPIAEISNLAKPRSQSTDNGEGEA